MAGGATPTSSAGHPSAGANTTSKLTFKSDHQSGAGQTDQAEGRVQSGVGHAKDAVREIAGKK